MKHKISKLTVLFFSSQERVTNVNNKKEEIRNKTQNKCNAMDWYKSE